MTDKQTENVETVEIVEDKATDAIKADSSEKNSKNNRTPEPVVVKKGGSALGLLAILIALGVGGAGYYFGQQQVQQIQQKLTALQSQQPGATAESPDFEQTKEHILKLVNENNQTNADKIAVLQREITAKDQALLSLQSQINAVSNSVKAEQPNDWLLSEADFLLTNALRKLVVDHDVDTSISLIKLADEALEKVATPQASAIRSALNNDLKQLLALNNVDQNAIMQRLSQLANSLDELTVLDIDFDDQENSAAVTDSVGDWQNNLKKSAVSFLNHFVRVTPTNSSKKELLAPNQDIYLRENIRLRLQIAILAVPRQQNELYKQSLEAVSSWIRSYFDTNSDLAKNFLKNIDELSEQSIYVDVPERLESLNALDQLLNKQVHEVKKVELSVDKGLTENNETGAAPETEQNVPATSEPVLVEPQQ
ncbi:uroporphyrinogen-III C-methyltransferase [Basfia succiniciproducens]|uniref:uroporphyrinogen-III C-methyltransferase n=1 Tax=Basfia succiniciproducens TaxID=653940 RepID=UPI0008CC0F29|nr:uroporphyrinogen-III C-methyltransferase [Basfia succiniciproducens]SEQ74818.1 uroporphyrin-3 C-methyltransferase [Basfia succiniciproducens]